MASNGSSATRCPTRTVDDAPAGEDVFGSHAPIVDAVHELITTERGGRTIGLEGTWGSGKSTVVRLLADRLAGSDSHVVVFDAWSHEGDPLRRSFLDKLITSLAAKGWVEREAWGDRRKELARRRRVEHTRPVSKIETPAIVAGAVAALFAILLSAGAVLLEVGLSAESNSPLWVGPAIHTILAVFVVVGAAVLWRRSRSEDASDAWLSLFSVDSVTESTSETIETPDPTSIEFESTFNDLMREALPIDRGRRLVLVVDNLDRVLPEDARAIWATLQTFLHHSQDARESWLDSLWVMLPYDRAGIVRLWSGSDSNDEEARANGTLAESFIDKSIQSRFEVPLPLLSDWRAYLESTLRSALPDCSEVDGYAAYRLYAHRLTGGRGRAPSPRELKQYVNRIGALHRRWQHELPFASLAYYASLGWSGIQVAERIRHDELPEPWSADLLAEDAEEHLAAIAFNTDPIRARQLMLGPLIDGALGQDASVELVELLDRPGFWEVLPQSPIVRLSMGIQALLTASDRLLDVPVTRRPDAEWREVTSLLARQGREVENWPALTLNLAEELSSLLSLVAHPAAADIASRVTAAPIPADGVSAWAEGVHALLGRFDWLTVHASGAPEAVRDALAHFNRLEGWGGLAGRLGIEPSARASLDESIVVRVSEAPGEALRALMVLRTIEPDIEWAPFVTAAVDRLREYAPSRGRPPHPTVDDSRWLLHILRIAKQAAAEERAALVQEGFALEYAWLASDPGDDGALGDWLYEELRQFSPESWANRRLSGYASSGKNLVDALLADPASQPVTPLAQAIERVGDFNVIPSIGAHSEGEALASALVAELRESDRFRTALGGDLFRALWPHVARAGDSDALDPDQLVRAACAQATFAAQLQSEPFAEGLMGMYAAVIAAHPNRDEAVGLAAWIAESLSALSPDQWQAAMADSDDWVALLAAVHGAAPDARVGGGFGQALAKFLEGVANGEGVTPLEAEQWERTVVPLLAPAVEGTYAQGVARAAVSAGGGLPEEFFDLVGDTLREPRIFLRSEILDGLLPDLVTERNAAGLSWLIDALQTEDVRRNAQDGALSALAEVVRTSLGHDEDDDLQLRKVATLIGLDLEPEPDR